MMSSRGFEREAIAGLLSELSAQGGTTANVIGHPEDDPTDPLTVDAVVQIAGKSWAIDHMRLVYEPTVLPAGDEAARILRGPLEQLADSHQCQLLVGVLPPRRRAATRPEIDAYYSNIISRAEIVITGDEDWFDQDGFTSVQCIQSDGHPNAASVQFATWLADTASIEEQVIAALETPLAHKLSGQLAVAKRDGYPVMLLIDQVQDPDRPQPSIFLASPRDCEGGR